MANCFFHGEREAAARCAVCGRSVCEECVKREGSYTFCSPECQEKGAAMLGRSEDVLAEKKKTNSSTLVRKLIYFFVLLAAIAAAYHFYANNKKAVDSKINSSVTSIKKETSKVIKETSKAIPKSSQMKRQKENLVK